jgi:DNA-directed RNA polymerase sigma subunit (sigma70/sigma32)
VRRDHIRHMIDKLPGRERKILELRFGFNGAAEPHSRAEVGVALKLTPERIRQIELRSLDVIRELPEAKQARDAV